MSIEKDAQEALDGLNEAIYQDEIPVTLITDMLESILDALKWTPISESLPNHEALVKVRYENGSEAIDWFELGNHPLAGWQNPISTLPVAWRELV